MPLSRTSFAMLTTFSIATVTLATLSRPQAAKSDGRPALDVSHFSLPAGHALASHPANSAAAGLQQTTPLDRGLFDQYCVTCHNERLKTAGLMLDKVDLNQISGNAATLEKVVRKLRTGQMPPPGIRRPDKPATLAFVAALETALDRAAMLAAPDPGRVVLHRLNRTEYVNAVGDLLALDIDGATLLPADNSGFGFDNNAETLSITPGLMARYVAAATKVARLAIGDPTIRPTTNVYKVAEFAKQDARMSDDLPFGTYGGLVIRHTFPLNGEYGFRIRMVRGGGNTILGIDEERQVEARLDHALLQRFKIGGELKGPDLLGYAIPEGDLESQRLNNYRLTADEHLETRAAVRAGPHLVTVAFTNTEPSVAEGALGPSRSVKLRDGAGGIDTVEILGPFNATAPQDSPSRRRIFVCHPVRPMEEAPCARKILSTLARRAYRRAITESDVEPLLKFYELGRNERGFDDGIQRAVEALLVSPKFLLRIERNPSGAEPGTVHRLGDFELASRLSFFLWRSIPDDELLALAERGRLKNVVVLAQQVNRMLADPRASRWMADFVGQWLLVRNLQLQEPDPLLFPDFDDTLRAAMVRETELLFESQVRENHSVKDLLRANYTFVNARLAEHYRIPGVYGSHFRRVPVTDVARQGLLGQASVLTVTSYAHRTSVVVRGHWVMENLIGAPPPPPPPNVPPLKENDGTSKPMSLRERMEQHRSNPVCATCHAGMDPMGFALENFDATGRWRDDDDGAPIDITSVLSDGTRIDSPTAFRQALLDERTELFVRTVTEKLLTFALGRGLEYYDAPTVRQLVRDAARDNYRWSTLLMGIIQSTPFQMRRVPEAEEIGPGASTIARTRKPVVTRQ